MKTIIGPIFENVNGDINDAGN